MRTAHRRIDPGLIAELTEAPHRFEFFQAVRLLERHFRATAAGRGRDAEVVTERVRFRNSLALSFAPSQIEALEAEHETGEDGVPGERLREVRITPRFMGMLGLHGALPAHYTERVADRERYHRDRAARAFFDLFSNRSLGQFYRAWKKYRLPLEYESDRENRFLPILLSLCGLGFPALRNRLREAPGGMDDEAIAYFAGMLQQRPLSAATLEKLLAGHFRVPVKIEQFVGRWYRLAPDQCSGLGGANAALGRSTLLGTRVWQRDLRVRIALGPLDRATFLAFLPGGAASATLARVLQLAAGARFEYEVRPILRAADVRGMSLEPHAGARLGFDTFLSTRPATTDRDDVRFELHSAH